MLLWMAVASEPRSASDSVPLPACTTRVLTFCRISVADLSASSSRDSESVARSRLVAYCEDCASVSETPSARAAATGSSAGVRNLVPAESFCWMRNSCCCCEPMPFMLWL